MSRNIIIASDCTKPDRIVLESLIEGVKTASRTSDPLHDGRGDQDSSSDASAIGQLKSLNNVKDVAFEPAIFVSWDISDLRQKLHPWIDRNVLSPYIKWAGGVVRNPTDVVMLTHLILYFSTTVPSALTLFYHFSWIHGVLHSVMQGYYVGTYTLMMHQHIHMHGILAPKFAWIDSVFPYVLDPLVGHTWNSYYYHHVKHHHVENNGPGDLSSTIQYQRDSAFDFFCYFLRFFMCIWAELPLYFLKKGRYAMAAKGVAGDAGTFVMIALLATYVNLRATTFVFMIPLLALRLGLMIGNWGQHAFVDEVDPDSDYRSSITLIDVASNRYCYNDGYHTSHHLNPRRHWRDHPVSFLSQKHIYASEQALVFYNIDYLMLTVRLLRKDYAHLAKCLVPIGEQRDMTLAQIEEMLKRKTRRFSEAEIKAKFEKSA